MSFPSGSAASGSEGEWLIDEDPVLEDELVAFHCRTPCDACGIQCIEGPRYHCRQCADFNMCGTCYRNSNTEHPGHTFEEIAAPLGSGVALTPLTADTLRELTDLNNRRGVDDTLVTAWLSQDSQNIDTKDIVQHDCSWMCAICQEGAEHHVHGSFPMTLKMLELGQIMSIPKSCKKLTG